MMTEQRDMRPHRREFDKNAYVNDWRLSGNVYGKMEADAVAGLPGVLSEENAAWCAANFIDDEVVIDYDALSRSFDKIQNRRQGFGRI